MAESPTEITAPDGRTLAVVGTYPSRTDAYERSLVLSAMQAPHWVLPCENHFALCVDPARAAEAAAELSRFEIERREKPPPAPTAPEIAAPHSTISLYIAGWILCAFYAAQKIGPAWWDDRGAASSREIMRGAWWEAFTALTLHANLEHLAANIAFGLLFAAFLLPVLGSGWTWLFIVLAGGLGNWLNAWGYRAVDHLSIGASTSVFAALGILVAAQATIRFLALRTVRLREFLLPVGAGLAFLAYLGAGGGDEQIDRMAHFFGLLAGVPFGIAGAWLRLGTRTPRALQALLAWSAAGLLVLCWRLAATHRV